MNSYRRVCQNQTIDLRDAPVAIIAECLDLLGTYEVDFTLFCRHSHADRVECAHPETPPRPEEIVHKTFCGT